MGNSAAARQLNPEANVTVEAKRRAKPLRMKLTRDNLDKLRRLKTADPKSLFAGLVEEDLLKLREIRTGGQCTIWDEHRDGSGLCVLVSPGPDHRDVATVTFRCCYYLDHSKGIPRYQKLGRYPEDINNPDKAREQAAGIRANARKNIDPRRPDLADKTVEGMFEAFLSEHAKKNNRTWEETERIFKRYVLPEWKRRRVEDIEKGDVAALLNKIEQKQVKLRVDTKAGEKWLRIGGTAVADATLAQVSKFFSWYVANYGSKDFRSPVVKDMRRGKTVERERVLRDRELRVMWPILAAMGAYGAVVQCALLTGQRFRKVGWMRRSEIKHRMIIPAHEEKGEWLPDAWVDNVWDGTSRDDPDNKAVSLVPLPNLAREIIAALPIIDADSKDHEDWVFSTNGRTPLQGWSKYKRRLDAKMLEALRSEARESGVGPESVDLEPWQHRDLRRTARTLMSRAGIMTEVAEHCLGHRQPRIERTYNRYSYAREKRDAFERLAALVARIVD